MERAEPGRDDSGRARQLLRGRRALIYLDSSAFVKLIVPEAGTLVLRRWLGRSKTVSSALLSVEVLRTVGRYAPQLLPSARMLLLGVDRVAISAVVLSDAESVPPVDLRSLDAIHLATARMLGRDLDSLVTYDARLAASARAHGLTVDSPE